MSGAVFRDYRDGLEIAVAHVVAVVAFGVVIIVIGIQFIIANDVVIVILGFLRSDGGFNCVVNHYWITYCETLFRQQRYF